MLICISYVTGVNCLCDGRVQSHSSNNESVHYESVSELKDKNNHISILDHLRWRMNVPAVNIE